MEKDVENINVSMEGFTGRRKEALHQLLGMSHMIPSFDERGNLLLSEMAVKHIILTASDIIKQMNSGNVAIAILRAKMKEYGLRLFPREIKGKIAELAKKTGIPEKDLVEFFKGEIELVTEEVLSSL